MVQQKIKEYMNAKGIKYSWVADKLGMSNTTFGTIMNGQRNLRADEFFAICKVLEVSPEIFEPEAEFVGT
jgi:transcriptional regulator with XRE-family HTH domain